MGKLKNAFYTPHNFYFNFEGDKSSFFGENCILDSLKNVIIIKNFKKQGENSIFA